MRGAYAVLGLGFLVIIAAAVYLAESPGTEKTMMTLSSSSFSHNGNIPSKYSCDGDRTVSPPLNISGVPDGAQSLVLIMDDPDVPKALRPDGVFDHWVVYGIDPAIAAIPEGGVAGALGVNGAGRVGYTGPCPPPEYEPTEHRYIFRLYAIDTALTFVKAPTKAEVLIAVEGHVLETAELIGRYDRKQ